VGERELLRLRGVDHQGDLPHSWLGHVVGKPDRRGNLYPAKQRPEQKIDAAVALLMAIGRAQASESDGAEDITAFLLNPVMG
jgi:phage terminase large subunit-like protein